ncbi:MAG: sensor histidine kinase, partial [Clostridia bacterium]|nr:sensor histidine kinase [Clostridia bacterium]
GIPADRLPGLFTGSLVAHRPKDAGRGNMGIGLSVCAAIIRAHGGEIQAANRKTGGAEFRFALKLEEENGQQ